MGDSRGTVVGLAVLRFEGTDAARFLQGYLTCNTQLLRTDSWETTALCNLQGRVVVSGWVQGSASCVDLLVHTSLAEATIAFLAPYQRFSRTRCRTLDTRKVFFEHSGTVSIGIAFRLAEVAETEADANDLFWSMLNQLRFVLVTEATSGKFLPQALGLVDAGAIAFDKGCYLGQEIVARAEYRGNVKKNLVLCISDKLLRAGLMDDLQDANNDRVGSIVQLAQHSALVIANRELDCKRSYHISEMPVTLAED